MITLCDKDGLRITAKVDDGGLVIEGQDLSGRGGLAEYEYALTLTSTETEQLAGDLGVSPDELLRTLEERASEIIRGEKTWLEGTA